MRRKPTDGSNSPRGGERKSKNVGRSARDQSSGRGRSLGRVEPDVRGSRRDSHAVAERVEEGERLQKVLSRAGLASRREVEEWIRAGRITVNDTPAVLGIRVGPADRIRLDGRLIRQRQVGGSARVFLIHRSPGDNLQQRAEAGAQSASSGMSEVPEEPGTSSSARGGVGAGPPILDRIPRRAGRRFIPVSPMPRVDGGLELVTSDGDLASKLQRSIRGLTSEFSVRIHGELSAQGLETILEGVLDTGQKLKIERCEAAGGEGSNRWYSLVARGASGKDVRQLFERQGALVSRVLRTHLGSLSLDRHLSRGQYRELSPEELEALLATAESGRGETEA
jgi:23S rRNA pseudouridine2605 synthase